MGALGADVEAAGMTLRRRAGVPGVPDALGEALKPYAAAVKAARETGAMAARFAPDVAVATS